MIQRHRVQVVVGGKVLTMGGSEDELHIQKVALCVNKKIEELEGTESYRCLPSDLKPVLIQLNLADELVQTQNAMEQLEADLRMKEDELAELKQTLVETQVKLEKLEGNKRR